MRFVLLVSAIQLAFGALTVACSTANMEELASLLNTQFSSLLVRYSGSPIANEFQWSADDLLGFLRENLRLCIRYLNSDQFHAKMDEEFGDTIQHVKEMASYRALVDALFTLARQTQRFPSSNGMQPVHLKKLNVLKEKLTKLYIDTLLQIGPERMEPEDKFVFTLMLTIYVMVGIFFSTSWMSYYLQSTFKRNSPPQGNK